MNVQPPEIISVDTDEDEEEEEEDEEDEDEGVYADAVEGITAGEAEDDEEEEDSSDSDDDEDGSEDETDVPTATTTAAPAFVSPPPGSIGLIGSKPVFGPTPPPPKGSISITDFTQNISVPVSSQALTNGYASAAPSSSLTAPPSSIPYQLNGLAPNVSGAGPSTYASMATGQLPAEQPITAPSKKTKRKQRTPSPSPPPLPPPPPMQTIRLVLTLGGPTNYEIDISQKAKETGQRPATPPLPPGFAPLPGEEPAEMPLDIQPEDGPVKKKRKKKNAQQEYYDTSDPFIDDSELAVDQRTYFAQTKQQGFYVSSGEVALMKGQSPKKPKSKKPLAATLHATASQAVAGALQKSTSLVTGDDASGDHLGASKHLRGVGITNGQNQPGDVKAKKVADGVSGPAAGWSVPPDDEGDEKTGEKRKRYITVVEGGKKRKIVNINSFHPDLQAAIEEMKQMIAKENWEQKGKFPPSLKPQLSKLAMIAISLDEYDDHFFNLMPVLFPYNKFTMTKLIKRTIYPEHVALLHQRQDELLKQLQEIADAGYKTAVEEWEKNVMLWDKRQEKLRLEAATNAGPGGAVALAEDGPISAAPTRHSTEENDGMDIDNALPLTATQGAGDKDKAAHPPAKKYRLTEQMKAIIWDLVLLSNECCRLENEKNGYDGSGVQVSDQGLRKVLYQKIVAAFPEGWMSSGQISRDVSAMKKRLEKEAMEHED